MTIPNNIPTDLSRDARSLRPLIVNKLVSFISDTRAVCPYI